MWAWVYGLRAAILHERHEPGKAATHLRIALIRHGPTVWNEEGRIQGQLDMPLSDAGRAKMAALSPPRGFETARAYSSPLGRAVETAKLLGLDPGIDARLIEHNWGRWQGLTREEILARDGADAFDRAGKGADFTPAGGEPTADLIARVRSFLLDAASADTDAIAITHRGVLRCGYVLATGWQMLTPMPNVLDLTKALLLEVREGAIKIAALNVDLPKKIVPS
jgi:probable phosphoglycerate mutase